MTEQLNKIVRNLDEAAKLLSEINPENPDLKNLIKENQWTIDSLETYSKKLVQNLKLTSKCANG